MCIFYTNKKWILRRWKRSSSSRIPSARAHTCERLASKVTLIQALHTADLKDYEEMATQMRTLRVEFDIYVQQTQR